MRAFGRFLSLFSISLILLFSSSSCQRWTRIQVKGPAEALIPLSPWEIPRFADDLDRASLRSAVLESLLYLDRLPAERTFQYGPRRASIQQLRETLLAVFHLAAESTTAEAFAERLREDFLWFRAAGGDWLGHVLFTGYYEPTLAGSLKPHGPYRYPLFCRPDDLLEIDLGAFRNTLKGQRLMGRLDGTRVVPYFSRDEIDGKGRLDGRGLEIVWLRDPVAAFFLHIQGSGRILLEDGRILHVGYAASNGHPYRSVGRLLVEQGAIPAEKVSMQAIRAYLEEHPEKARNILHSNPSYVFFRFLQDGPVGSIGVRLTPGRSIATDSRLFPKGGVAFIRLKAPKLDAKGNHVGWNRISRLVLNQDTGGAIRGAGRADLFFGSGQRAERIAGRLKHEGRLYFLLKKGPED